MERLTTWTNGERAAITNNNGETPLQQSLKIPVVIERLAKIEDILGNEYDLDRLRELIKADREGRCVVLPCKVGDSMWVHDKDGKPREMKLGSPDIRCYCKEEDNFCMTLCAEKRTGVCAYRLHNDGKDIGKTVFRTREEAESALKARDGN